MQFSKQDVTFYSILAATFEYGQAELPALSEVEG